LDASSTKCGGQVSWISNLQNLNWRFRYVLSSKRGAGGVERPWVTSHLRKSEATGVNEGMGRGRFNPSFTWPPRKPPGGADCFMVNKVYNCPRCLNTLELPCIAEPRLVGPFKIWSNGKKGGTMGFHKAATRKDSEGTQQGESPLGRG